jgi:hypothetical protein
MRPGVPVSCPAVLERLVGSDDLGTPSPDYATYRALAARRPQPVVVRSLGDDLVHRG